ncbi:hypothetical protein F2Q68_00003168 [Brassica cretica]|uniref:Uncharacterized protein n=1 Tax=Brassica cretica TaxID=69181 RepID=A0A8S9JKJ5_BRACR|nr:hypothetical protein F2Q68_00003168 [Brassica cretica]
MTRLDSVEKENAFLRYEYTVLEKELKVKTEETRKSMKFPDMSISMSYEAEERKMEIKRRDGNKSDLMMKDEVQSRKLRYDLLMEQIGNVRAEKH